MAHSRGGFFILLIIVVLVTYSCAPTPSTVLPAATPTNPPTLSPTNTATPTVGPTIAATTLVADTPTATPIGVNIYLPFGLATAQSASGEVTYYDLQGQPYGVLQSPNLGTGIVQQAHIAGPITFTPDPILPPLVYYASQNGGELWITDSSNLSLLMPAPNLFNIIGVPGSPIMAYSLIENSDVGIRSLFYIGDPQSLLNSNAVLDSISNLSYVQKPLAITIQNDQTTGIWYTTVPYGIGGDIVFEPRETLNYLNLSDSSITTLLDLTKGPAGMSADQTWIAYTATSNQSPLSIVHNFDFSTAVTYPLREDSNRGAGDAVFSPDNQYVAWREAGGSLLDQPSTFHETIRIASVDGSIITELPDSSLAAVAAIPQIGSVIPIGYLNLQTLALEVRSSSLDSASIVTVKLDGSELTYLVTGAFVGFLYP